MLKGVWPPIALLSPGPDDSLQGDDRIGAIGPEDMARPERPLLGR